MKESSGKRLQWIGSCGRMRCRRRVHWKRCHREWTLRASILEGSTSGLPSPLIRARRRRRMSSFRRPPHSLPPCSDK